MRLRAMLIPLLALCYFVLAPVGLADDNRYNFASVQSTRNISVQAGGEGSALLYFYNASGNRITYITLVLDAAPEGFAVDIVPPPKAIDVQVGGTVVTVSPNLYVEPGTLLSQPVSDVPEGSASIPLADGTYVVAKVVEVRLRAPAEATPGPAGTVRVVGEAAWLGQAGAASLKQARDFEFTVEVVAPGGDSERVLGAAGGATAQNPLVALVNLVDDSLPAFIAGALAILLVLRLTGRRANKPPRE